MCPDLHIEAVVSACIMIANNSIWFVSSVCMHTFFLNIIFMTPARVGGSIIQTDPPQHFYTKEGGWLYGPLTLILDTLIFVITVLRCYQLYHVVLSYCCTSTRYIITTVLQLLLVTYCLTLY